MVCRQILLAFVATLAASGTHAAAPAEAGRFSIQGQLLPEPPARANERFSLRAQLAPSASRPDPNERFLLAARLEAKNRAICTPTTEIFSDGFEAP